MLPLHISENMYYGSETENKYQRPQSFLQTRDVQTKRQYTNFLSSLALDSSSIVYLRQTSSAAIQTMFVAVHPKIEFENCISVSFTVYRIFQSTVEILWSFHFRRIGSCFIRKSFLQNLYSYLDVMPV